MAQNTVHVNLESLEVLQKELKAMAEELYDIQHRANRLLDIAHEHWRDAQFEKFADEFEKTNAIIREASNDINFYADDFLQKRIDIIKKIIYIDF